ncbi:hypothetical protein E1180_21835 [Roseibium denhamense]|uniref:Secreted protein n=1 Tax=Roseibium denhamense TaxID=76305 RepID=A0ABY1NSA3_9HYPH|nr:hypothetical protein [Roseibium denhamense]MTI08146.1 hypothetical protein [Roseibium denhamense]SMP16702.1 hypothetical protein SAMN06265374_1742 [Roseibium denhamense]
MDSLAQTICSFSQARRAFSGLVLLLWAVYGALSIAEAQSEAGPAISSGPQDGAVSVEDPNTPAMSEEPLTPKLEQLDADKIIADCLAKYAAQGAINAFTRSLCENEVKFKEFENELAHDTPYLDLFDAPFSLEHLRRRALPEGAV